MTPPPPLLRGGFVEPSLTGVVGAGASGLSAKKIQLFYFSEIIFKNGKPADQRHDGGGLNREQQ